MLQFGKQALWSFNIELAIMNYDILFAVIAPREVHFFSNVAAKLKQKHGLKTAFLTFYEPGDRYLLKEGHKVFSLHKIVREYGWDFSREDIDKLKEKYNVENIRSLLLHEKLTFGRYNENKLLGKLISYDKCFDEIIQNNKIGCIIQELGAFVAPISLYFNSQANNINHVFIEPSMYKGYLFFNLNTVNVNLNRAFNGSGVSRKIADEYLSSYHNEKVVVIPDKDKHHFQNAKISRLFNKRNIKRFAEKMYYKHFKREREEYNAIWNHVKKHTEMFVKHHFIKRLYSPPDYSEEYIYYPLHVPLDFQLTFREPMYLNQISIVEYLSNILPYGVKIYFKEHPASVGAYDYWQLSKISQNDNVRFINPGVNSYDLIKNALSIVTINSKVGAEAIAQGKRVFVLGNPYYLMSRQAIKINSLNEFQKIDFSKKSDSGVDMDFLLKAASASLKGELYLNSGENISTFTDSLMKVINEYTFNKSTF